jgi:hypothetical protein
LGLTFQQEGFEFHDSNKERNEPKIPGLTLFRARGAINGSLKYQLPGLPFGPYRYMMKTREPLIERVSSVSLSMLNTRSAPYTIVVLVEKGERLLAKIPSLARGEVDFAGDSVFPDHLTAQAHGLRPSGRCTGLTQFLLMVLTLFRHWEEEWLKTLASLDDMTKFVVSGPRLPFSVECPLTHPMSSFNSWTIPLTILG